MKKFLLGAAGAGAMALAFGLSTMPAHAISVSEFCKANGDLGMTHGECVGGINKSIPQFCKDFLASDPVGFEATFGSTSVGACVSQIRHQIKDL
jgi:hypothetical protein